MTVNKESNSQKTQRELIMLGVSGGNENEVPLGVVLLNWRRTLY
jgi:hypothetical protein